MPNLPNLWVNICLCLNNIWEYKAEETEVDVQRHHGDLVVFS